jgi:transmembrane sensor
VRHGRDIRRAAALLLAAIGLGGGSTYWYRTAVVETFTVTTTRGERREVHARDGTMFTLGPASSLRYTARRNGRKSTLTGIADFVVVHDASRPFVVHTSNTITRDVGTEFSVRAYAGDARVIVAVSSGVVEVAAARRAGGGVTDGHVVCEQETSHTSTRQERWRWSMRPRPKRTGGDVAASSSTMSHSPRLRPTSVAGMTSTSRSRTLHCPAVASRRSTVIPALMACLPHWAPPWTRALRVLAAAS